MGTSKRGVAGAEVERVLKESGGRLNVTGIMAGRDVLTVSEVAKMGITRVSGWPQLQFMAMAEYGQRADEWSKSAA